MIDFGFPEIPVWQRTRAMLADGAIGRLRHVVVTWNVENQATRLRLESWKTRGDDGGGVLGNFVSHCFHYLEWFCGPIAGLNARIFTLPCAERDTEIGIALALAFASGAGGSLQMSCGSFLGSGHRIELYGEDGTLVLTNASADYMRGFELEHAGRVRSCLAAGHDRSGFRRSRFRRAHRFRIAARAALPRCLRGRRCRLARDGGRISRAGFDRRRPARACRRPFRRCAAA